MTKMTLSPTVERIVLHWGEMSSRWGVSRTVSQIHVLLYLSEKPLPADEIADTSGWPSSISAPGAVT